VDRNPQDWKAWAERLRSTLAEAVRAHPVDAILLSGGLDTSILAYLLAQGSRPVALTVLIQDAPRPDEPFALELARSLRLEHHVLRVDQESLERGIRWTIQVLGSFDPMTVRNQAVIAVALDKLVELGLGSAMTGDGADELFAGYSFLFSLDAAALEPALRGLWSQMSFDSLPMGERLGLRMAAPYLEPSVRSIAEEVAPHWLAGEHEGPRVGKWLLRKAFEHALPSHFIWRRKDPIEVGSGASVLPQRYRDAIHEGDFRERANRRRKEHGIRLRDPEHLHYFDLYLEVHGPPEPGLGGPKQCPDCGGGLELSRRFCKRCGAYPV